MSKLSNTMAPSLSVQAISFYNPLSMASLLYCIPTFNAYLSLMGSELGGDLEK